MNKLKIGIYGSAVNNSSSVNEKAIELGKELSKLDHILVTGAGPGIPYLIASTAYRINSKVEIWGFAPTITEKALLEYTPNTDLSIYRKIKYIPSDFEFSSKMVVNRQYRNLISTAMVDAGIIIAGRWGSMGEFVALREMGKVVGVLTDTGGVADELFNLTKNITKESGSKVIFNNNPAKLLKSVLAELR